MSDWSDWSGQPIPRASAHLRAQFGEPAHRPDRKTAPDSEGLLGSVGSTTIGFAWLRDRPAGVMDPLGSAQRVSRDPLGTPASRFLLSGKQPATEEKGSVAPGGGRFYKSGIRPSTGDSSRFVG